MTDTRIRHQPTTGAPYGCSWCGDERHHHGAQWTPIIGTHTWMEPNQAQILDRMTARRADRLAAEPASYHATTGWDPEPDGESAVPCCADCMGVCFRWERIQARLNRQRWQLHPFKNAKSGGWGGGEPWPF
ncbi:hypothetical protein ACFWGI_39780 [Streptomyces niveus]|uniref:hypothetical protein n=1 Tax=Streptomyces niveus TaxID=193462 RepID=UPI003654D798